MRNGNRWRVTAINPDDNRLAARRLDDNTFAVFDGDYVHEHITQGHAVTMHSAQGVTADTTHAVISEAATRALFYVAISRGREANTAYLYQRTPEHEYQQEPPDAPPDAPRVMQRGSSQHAGQLLRAIVANNDEHPVTAHDVAARSFEANPPELCETLLRKRTGAVTRRRANYQIWQSRAQSYGQAMAEARERYVSRSQDESLDCGIEL